MDLCQLRSIYLTGVVDGEGSVSVSPVPCCSCHRGGIARGGSRSYLRRVTDDLDVIWQNQDQSLLLCSSDPGSNAVMFTKTTPLDVFVLQMCPPPRLAH